MEATPKQPNVVGVKTKGIIYGAPAEELPSYAEELPGYEELAQADEVVEATTTGMMMDPSYYFQYKSADSERIEDADSSGSVIGSYSYLR